LFNSLIKSVVYTLSLYLYILQQKDFGGFESSSPRKEYGFMAGTPGREKRSSSFAINLARVFR